MKPDTGFAAISQADGYVATRVTFYAAMYPKLRQAAFEHGYALPIHGSLTKDLDVLAVPWVETASDPACLVKALADAAGGFVVGSFKVKPHGRLAWTINFGSNGGYIDLSVMPRVPASITDADVASLASVDPGPPPPKSGGVLP